MKLAPQLRPDEIVLVNLSGRGDKDLQTVAKALGQTGSRLAGASDVPSGLLTDSAGWIPQLRRWGAHDKCLVDRIEPLTRAGRLRSFGCWRASGRHVVGPASARDRCSV